LYARFTTIDVVDATIEANGGVSSFGIATGDTVGAHIDRSTVLSSGYAVHKNDPNTMLIGGSRLEGTVASQAGVLKCVTSYNGTYDPLGAACQ
jgi:hypothetical protein